MVIKKKIALNKSNFCIQKRQRISEITLDLTGCHIDYFFTEIFVTKETHLVRIDVIK